MRKNKYSNRKTILDGITFDSVKEARRYQELKLMEKAGEISCLEMQQKYVLIPAQYEHLSREEYVKGKGKKTKGKCIERECSYVADFVYVQNGEIIVEDTKGFRTRDYILKRKMMLFFYGIRIKEV